MRVTYGHAITRPGAYRSEDFYVGRPGAAANPRGFHKWLAAFIGWDLPELPARDGRLAPLYMEQVFPLLFVEQRRGWGGIQAQMPYSRVCRTYVVGRLNFSLHWTWVKMKAVDNGCGLDCRPCGQNGRRLLRLLNTPLSG